MPSLSVIDKRHTALELRLEGHAIADIATALHVSPGRVSQLIGEIICRKTEAINHMADRLRTLELERIDRMLLHWYMRAKAEPKAAQVLLHWAERRHRLLGLDVSKAEWSGPGGGSIYVNASALDLSKLIDEELRWLQRIVSNAGPQSPLNDAGDIALDCN